MSENKTPAHIFLPLLLALCLGSCNPEFHVPTVSSPLGIVNYWQFDVRMPGYDPADPHSGDVINQGYIWEKSPLSGWKINKTYDDTRLWVQFFGDILPLESNVVPDNYFTGVFIDGANTASVSLTGLPGKNITAVINDFSGCDCKAGEHVVDVMIGTSGGTRAAWQFSAASELRIMEIMLPPAKRPYR